MINSEMTWIPRPVLQDTWQTQNKLSDEDEGSPLEYFNGPHPGLRSPDLNSMDQRWLERLREFHTIRSSEFTLLQHLISPWIGHSTYSVFPVALGLSFYRTLMVLYRTNTQFPEWANSWLNQRHGDGTRQPKTAGVLGFLQKSWLTRHRSMEVTTFLHHAIRQNQGDAVFCLLQSLQQLAQTRFTAPLEAITKETFGNAGTILHEAVVSGSRGVVQAVIKFQPKIQEQPNTKGDLPLHQALRRRDQQLVQLLACFGPKIEDRLEIVSEFPAPTILSTSANKNLSHESWARFSSCAATFKIAVIGDGGVGKSTFIHKVETGESKAATKYVPTIGATVTPVVFPTNHGLVGIEFWELVQSSRYCYIHPGYFRDMDGAIFMWDCSYPSSINNVLPLAKQMKEAISQARNVELSEVSIPKILLTNKVDLTAENTRPTDSTKQHMTHPLKSHHHRSTRTARKLRCPSVEVSSLKNFNVEKACEKLLQQLFGTDALEIKCACCWFAQAPSGPSEEEVAQMNKLSEELSKIPLPDEDDDI